VGGCGKVRKTCATTQNKSSSKSFGKSALISHNYTTEFPLVTMERHKFTPKLPLPLRRSPLPSNTPTPRPTPLTIPNGIRIHALSRFATVHFPDRHTHRPTDGLGECSNTAYARYRPTDRERRANNAKSRPITRCLRS